MKDRFAIFLDIDGTIFDGEAINQKDIDAINRVREEGHLVFINSGRTLGMLPEKVTRIEVDGFVLAMGTHSFFGDTVIENRALPKALVEKIIDYGFLHNLRLELQSDTKNVYLNSKKITDRNLFRGEKIYEKFPDIKIYKFVIFGHFSQEDIEFFSHDFDVFQYETYGEVAPLGYSKAKGIEETEKYYGVPHENTIAIGDSWNDKDMIEYAALGVAMGNGEDRLKKIADFITEPIEKAGVSYAMEKFVLKR